MYLESALQKNNSKDRRYLTVKDLKSLIMVYNCLHKDKITGTK